MDLLRNLQKSELKPLLGAEFNASSFCDIDLSLENELVRKYNTHEFEGLSLFIKAALSHKDAQAGMGGYLEQRAIYNSQRYFEKNQDPRNIHLGIDLWIPALTAVFAPIAGKIHSFQNNNKGLDYGGTIILSHEVQSVKFHTLYGHLSLASLADISVGQTIQAGKAFTTIGNPAENGGWYPHLHFQIIKDLKEWEGDYPGVCNSQDLDYYRNNCPDPSILIQFA